jgi:hypothetical protein
MIPEFRQRGQDTLAPTNLSLPSRVRGRSQRRISIAALACSKQGDRSHLVYQPTRHADHQRGATQFHLDRQR